MTPRSPHRAWIEIDHRALVGNLATVRRLAGDGKQVIGVVKANAYGHGDLATARTLLGAGVERLAVATVSEALRLRAAEIGAPILVLWGVGEPEAGPAVAACVGMGFGARALVRRLPVNGRLVRAGVAYAGTRVLGEARLHL